MFPSIVAQSTKVQFLLVIISGQVAVKSHKLTFYFGVIIMPSDMTNAAGLNNRSGNRKTKSERSAKVKASMH